MRVTIIATGGTIAKTYDESDGSMRIARPIIKRILDNLRLPDLELAYRNLLSKDSLYLTDEDRRLIVNAVHKEADQAEAVIILHGTDTLEVTGHWLYREIPDVPVPVILTGAMRPYEFRDSDAIQNVTESLLACRQVVPGVYVVMHNRVLRFPGVFKNHATRSFDKNPPHCRGESSSEEEDPRSVAPRA